MKKITYKNFLELLTSKTVLAVSGGLILMSCGAQMGGYTETDGVYYDPNKDTLPEGSVMNSGNKVGEYYHYQAKENENPYLNSDNRAQNWKNNQNSDWGTFAGTDTYYTDNWGWGSSFGMYSGYGFGMGFGWGSPWGYNWGSPWSFGMNYGWESPWSYGGYYSPWGMGYSPWYGYGNFGYSPYYGNYYSPYYYNTGGYNTYGGGFVNRRSGADGVGRNYNNNPSSTFRSNNSNNSGFRNNTGATPQRSTQGTVRPEGQPRFRTNPEPNTNPRYNTPREYNQPMRTSPSDGGFRSGGFRSGGFDSGSSNSNSGGARSGGFRR